MPKLVPVAKVEHLILANEMSHERPDLGPIETVRAALGGIATPDEMISVTSRMVALRQILMSNPDLRPWLIEAGKDEATIDGAIFNAAARAPLTQTQFVADLAFDLASFKSILLEKAQPQGRA
jgi:hypothetical protein